MASAELPADVVERTVLVEHEGKSGAALERVRLADGRALMVKRVTAESDLTLRLTGGTVAREYLLWRAGVLDRLPRGVTHAVVDGWLDGEATVLVMRDLGPAVLTWDDRLDAARCRWTMERVAALHRHFLGQELDGTGALEPMLGLFSPQLMRPLAEAGNELAVASVRGWEYFPELVPADVAGPVLSLLADPRPLADGLRARPATLVHGDLATVNMAFEGDDLVLLDWAMPTAAPGALDVARFLVGCASVVEASREDVIGMYAEAAGPAYDDTAMRLALLSALVWLGWNKALDIVEGDDESFRARETADLAWWVARARAALGEGDL